jgi:hypothetical protein
MTVIDALDTWMPGDAQATVSMVNMKHSLKSNCEKRVTGGQLTNRHKHRLTLNSPSYTLPGGENYREVLLTLPTKTGAATNAARYDELNNIAARRNLTDAESDEMVAIEQAEFNGESGRAGEDFASGHFDEKNVLAHMRLNDRTGPNGERILFIEEIQSDWHQKGRDKGYQKSGEVTQESAKEFFGITDDDWSQMTPDTRQSYVDEINEGGQHIEQGKRGQVPDAPLKKTWHEMSFRRVARMAAEEGYDAIAWTPGKMQAERYDLSKQIDELRYRQNDDGTFDIVPVRNGNTIQAEEFEGVSKDRLSDVVGKEVAEKMAKGEGESDPRNNSQTLRGVDLEVGGAGMKGFYDQMLKTYAAKWGKKFGAKVGVSGINTDQPRRNQPVMDFARHKENAR